MTCETGSKGGSVPASCWCMCGSVEKRIPLGYSCTELTWVTRYLPDSTNGCHAAGQHTSFIESIQLSECRISMGKIDMRE